MNAPVTVLVIDDEAGIRRSLSGILADEGYRVLTAASGREGIDMVTRDGADLVLLDIWMEGMDGIAVLGHLRKELPHLPVIMMSGHGTIETAVSAIRMGAFDYLEKPLSLDRVTLTVSHALSQARLTAENARLKAQIHDRWRMLGDSAPLNHLRQDIQRVAGTCARVLISGENGAGKELVARALHEGSPRHDKPFIEINCAALPEHLIESELFGYEKGAFTGADTPKPGMFELAHGGTLFLDEVGDMSLATQARVLRVLQEGKIQRLGGVAPRDVDVWVIAATHRDLKAAIAGGQFREDLFYRLNVVPLRVPALRERPGDIPLLAAHFAERASAEQGLTLKRFSPRVMDILGALPWPGNVRELKNIVERLLIMSRGDAVEVADLPAELLNGLPSGQVAGLPSGQVAGLPSGQVAGSAAGVSFAGIGGAAVVSPSLPLRDAREKFEAEYIRRVLESCGGNISRAAEQLKVERSNLSKKIRQLGITVDSRQVAGE
ncbi:MAG: sigma-54 dependent transcriptional regulator [Nitrospirota bacterium]|nr:sigma-54 dependent transcriptional regulator [Nitrospirota bacterium]